MSVFEVPVRRLVSGKQDLIVVDTKTSVAKALLLMQQYGVLSLPVMNDKFDTKDPESVPFSGVVDITDILMYVAFGNFNEATDKDPTPEQMSGEKLSFLTVSDVVGAALKLQTGLFYNGLFILKDTDTLKRALELSRGGVQRMLVDFGEGRYKVLSQMDILRYLSICDEDWVEDVSLKTIDGLSVVHRHDEYNELCTMKFNESALTGFRRMLRNKCDAVAVLNDDGKLIATLSPSDLRFLFERTGSLKDVLMPVTEFLADIHGTNSRKQLKVKTSDDVRAAVFKCVLGKVHRVWVVDEDSKPTACLRCQDILDELYDASRHIRNQ
jgi:CBS domain-containing protein